MEKIRNIIDPKDIEVIIYHHPCVDGYSSAFVAKLYVSSVICIPKKINNTIIDYNLIKGKNVLMVDIVTDDYQQVREHAKNLIILDHHITNKDKLKNCQYAYFDMNKSGVGLAWEYFFRTDEKMPLFLKCIMDRDIWTWIYPESKNLTEGLYDELNLDDLDFNTFMDLMDEYLNKDENKPLFMKYYNLGEIYNKQKKKNIEETIKHSYNKYNLLLNDITYTIYIYNVTGSYTSDLGNYVVENMDCDFCVIWHYNHNTEEYKYSFRSIDRKTDVGMIAQSYGGGGHRNAAGLSSKLHPKELFKYKKIEMMKNNK